MRRLLEGALAVTLLLFAVVALLVALLHEGATDCEEFRFDRGAWAEREPGTDREETALAEGLVECDVLRGQTESEVRALLGRADYGSRRSWQYELGTERSYFAVDSDFLYIDFSRSGQVTGTAIHPG